MRYEYVCYNCAYRPEGTPADAVINTTHEREISIKNAPQIGSKAECPACGKKTAVRIMSTNLIAYVKGKAVHNWKPGETMRAEVNGREMAFSFVDHVGGDPALKRELAQMGGKGQVTEGPRTPARFDEKSGRMVVDVVSNVKDPLGTLQRNIESKGDKIVRQPKQAVKTRTRKK